MNLPQNSARISAMRTQGKDRRKELLALVPHEFKSNELADAAGITKQAAKAQIQKMQRSGEVTPTSAYKTPRTYRKMA